MLQTIDFFLLKIINFNNNKICSFHLSLNLILIFVHFSTLYFHTIWISLENNHSNYVQTIILHQGFLKYTRSVSSCICTYMRNHKLQKVTLRPLINTSFHFPSFLVPWGEESTVLGLMKYLVMGIDFSTGSFLAWATSWEMQCLWFKWHQEAGKIKSNLMKNMLCIM